MNNIKVSTITPCFRMQKYLKLFLEELPKQTIFENIEVVLDHNEPTEEELIWVREFQEKYPNRLKHIVVNPVEPIATSMNRCIRESSGEYLTIWNVDDLRTSDSIEKQVKLLEQNLNCDIANGNFIIVRNFGSKNGQFVDHSIYEPGHKEFTRGMVLGPFFMFRKTLLEKSGVFDEQLKSGADFDLAVRLAIHNSNVLCTPGILGYYLNEGKGASTNGDGKQPTERTVIELRYGIYDKIENNWLEKTKTYKIKEVLTNGLWESIEKYVPNYEEFVKNNI
jgi:glycosyltransferase involved in cell wall biosynthesis